MYIDTHCHLNFKAFKKDLDEVIDRAKKSVVEKIIIPGAKLDSSKKAVEISQNYDGCFAAVGIHPHHVLEYTSLLYSNEVKSMKDHLGSLAREEKVVAIGEIGLDYHEYKGYPPITGEIKIQQKELLMLQINIAQESHLPIIFHCRDAHDDQLGIIDDYIKSKSKQIAAVFHCFDGDENYLKAVLELGFYIGFDGNITYPGNERLVELVKQTPLDRLLLETDSPFLTPVPLRGQRNEPANLVHTAAYVAKIKEIPQEHIAEVTTSNALKLFML